MEQDAVKLANTFIHAAEKMGRDKVLEKALIISVVYTGLRITAALEDIATLISERS